jgi:hypothetical protein
VKRKLYLPMLWALVLGLAGLGAYGSVLDAPLKSAGFPFILAAIGALFVWFYVWALLFIALVKRSGGVGKPVRFTTKMRVVSISSMVALIGVGTYLLETGQPLQILLLVVAVAPVAVLGINLAIIVQAGRRQNPA